MTELGHKSLYDLSVIRSLPILDVCDRLGLHVEKRGKDYWCKVRPERTASVILHTDSNVFYDFGNQRKGGVIDLVQYAMNCTVGDAIAYLGKQFNISPSRSPEDLLQGSLTDWEYRQIGLYGDLASKNISFPIETASINELSDLSYAYRMTMNELREFFPDDYAEIIESVAKPYVDNLRNEYYRDIWNYYDFLRTFSSASAFFDSERTQAHFAEQKRAMDWVERSFCKACRGTSMEFRSLTNHDPLRVLAHILQGTLTFSLGSATSSQLTAAASEAKCGLLRAVLTYDDYHRLDLRNFLHTAEFDGNQVDLKFLDKDSSRLFPLLKPYLRQVKEPLNIQINKAHEKTRAPAQENSPQEKELVH